MGSIDAIVSDLEYGRTQLLKSIDGLSQREMTQIPIYDEWTIKDVLAHVLGWDRRVLNTLPLMLQHRASEIPGVDVEEYNRESVAAGRLMSLDEVLAAIKAAHRQIVEILAPLDHKEIDMRRERHGRIITIRSYVIDVMTDHEREHALEIAQWRKALDQAIDLDALRHDLVQAQADFWAVLEGLDQAELLDPAAVAGWSVKDVAGHLADWEELMLQAAHHIYDPSLPPAPLLGDSTDAVNAHLAARHQAATWPAERKRLRDLQLALREFVARLKQGDCLLRGPYPWPNDQGALAELVTHATEHITDHLPDLERWRSQKLQQRPPSKPWIKWQANDEATGLLKKEYEAAVKRAGKVWNIVRVQSLNPAALQASMRLYTSVMHRATKMVGRVEREMIAVVVSQANQCHY
jgi:uncharacterized damage-inducible protein DinB